MTGKGTDTGNMGSYRERVITAMKNMGIPPDKIPGITDATVRNALRQGRKPEDVAWAILQ